MVVFFLQIKHGSFKSVFTKIILTLNVFTPHALIEFLLNMKGIKVQ